MAYETIRYELSDAVAVVTLAQPDKLNAFGATMMRELIDAFDQVDADDAVRAVIITGEGRAFCAGADLSSGAGGFITGADAPLRNDDGSFNYASAAARDGGGLLTLRIFRCLKPVIGAINGAAIGIGATMTLPMDVRIASRDARFGFVFGRRGIVPEAASSWFLPRLVGISCALEWCMSGRIFGADEARDQRLVRAVHDSDALLTAARALARDLVASSAPVSVALTRQMLWRGLGMRDPMEAHRIDSRAILSRGNSEDAAEGVASFLEKRDASFPNRVSTDMPDFFPFWDELPYA